MCTDNLTKLKTEGFVVIFNKSSIETSVSEDASKRKVAKMLPAAVVGLASLVSISLSGAVSAQEYKKITRLGTSQSVCDGGIETAEQLQAFFANNPDKVRAILADSGWSGDADTVMTAVANGELTERAYPTGTRLAWMGGKKNGQYVALPYREWAGKQSFSGFELNVNSGCKVYNMAIPKACCNISLVSVSEDTSEACAPKPVAVVEPAAPVVEEPAETVSPLALIPFIGAFAGSETRARFEPSWNMDMRDTSGIAGLKAGILKPLSEKTSLAGIVSYYDRSGINDGNIYPEDNFAIDLGIERKLSERAFIGGGIGAWNVDDSDFRDTSLYGLVGGDIGKSNLQWFLEGRVFDSDSETLDSISDNKMFSAGLRYLIK